MSASVRVSSLPPEHAAAVKANDWLVANASRPIPGEITCQGPFRHGTFYAAGPVSLVRRWDELDASLVEVLSNDEVKDRVAEMCAARDVTLEEILSDFDNSWADLAAACDLPREDEVPK